jgi:hypothetical protein
MPRAKAVTNGGFLVLLVSVTGLPDFLGERGLAGSGGPYALHILNKLFELKRLWKPPFSVSFHHFA